jgi:hypothetical protein
LHSLFHVLRILRTIASRDKLAIPPPRWRAKRAASAATPSTPEEMRQKVATEFARWQRVLAATASNGTEALRRSAMTKLPEAELCHFGHGNAWSIYFSDPEGNRMEVYSPTPWYVSQPFGQPLDLTEPAYVILAKTETMVRQDPTSCPIEAWSADMRGKLDEVHA